jgi:putative oxygen-independent coproporphyrinogen III oxidase
MPPSAVYVHVPFCVHHCGYCDFTVIAGRDHLMSAWLTALENEIEQTAWHVPIDSVFIGGGTPTHLPPLLLGQLLQLITDRFDVAATAEFSIEANPDGLSDDTIAELSAHSVNRISLGVQSFDDACLQVLERGHTRSTAVETIRRCASAVPNVSIDLMFAVPGQSLDQWQETLDVATSLPVTHVSTYGLTWETGTRFLGRERRGELVRIDDEVELAMYLAAMDHLQSHGFTHYEVSNFAKPQFNCRHNQVYWDADEYFAFGPGASRYVDGVRSTNSRNVARWIQSWLKNEPCVESSETLNPEEKAREAIMLALRMRQGLEVDTFEQRFGCSLDALVGDQIRRHRDAGMLELRDGRLRMTDQGLLIADTIVGDLL